MLIGLYGRARSGKDTAYGYIRKNFHSLDRPVVKKSFAALLKKSAAAALGTVTEAPVEAMDRLKEKGEIKVDLGEVGHTLTGREFLQKYGTEAHRNLFGEDFWVDALLPKNNSHHKGQIWVVTDVRFNNEARRIQNLNGRVWQLRRRAVEEVVDHHASEGELASFMIDEFVYNDDSFTELEDEVCNCVMRMLKEGEPAKEEVHG